MPNLKQSSRFIVSGLAGMLFAVAFPKFNLPLFAWLAPGIVLGLSHRPTGKGVFLHGFLSGLGCWLVMFYWLLLIPFHFYGLVAFLGQASVGAAYMGLWCWLCWRLWPARNRPGVDLAGQWHALSPAKKLAWPLGCAVAWVATEMTLIRVLTGFPGYLGASQFRWLGLIQICDCTGIYGVSFLMVWLSVSGFCVVLAGLAEKDRPGTWLLPVLPPLLLLIGVLAYGRYELSGGDDCVRHYKIALVQPAIPQKMIWDANEKTNRFNKLMEMSQAALEQKPDLLIWPETALPEMITRNQFTQDAIVNLLHSHKTWMLFGASDYEAHPDANGVKVTEWFNGAFLINPAGEMVGRYHKRHLVPFGEFMPGAHWFPWLARFRAAGAGLTPGGRPGLLYATDPRANFSTLICYEDLFPQEVREGQNQDTDFLVNITNDGWFGDSAAQWLHLVDALFRSVELHLPLVRCCNNGITCWIDARGGLHNVYFPGSNNEYQSGYKLIEVPLASSQPTYRPTFYRLNGDVFGWSCVLLTTGLVLFQLGNREAKTMAGSGQPQRGRKSKVAKVMAD